MHEIHAQLLEQRRLALVPLGAQRREPPRPQPALRAHAAADAVARRAREAIAALLGEALGLEGRCVSGNGAWAAVGGWEELEILL